MATIQCNVSPCDVTLTVDASLAIAQLRTETAAITQDPSLMGLDLVAVTEAYAFGSGSVLMMFFIGYVLAIAVGMVKKA